MGGKLEGKTAIVTGAGRGIGRAVALAFAREGASVVVNDLGGSVGGEGHDTRPADDTVAAIEAAGGRAIASYADVADMYQAEALIKQALDAWDRLDILVNAAGIMRERMIFNLTEDDWDSVIRVHLKGTFATTKFAAIHWRQRRDGGRLINFTSGSGLFGAPYHASYTSAKGGIWSFTQSCARGLGRYGVTANSIAPAATTRMAGNALIERRRAINPEADVEAELDPANIATPLIFLASDAGARVTGECFGINGFGITLYSKIQPVVHLQGTQPWDVDQLFARFEEAFPTAFQPKDPV